MVESTAAPLFHRYGSRRGRAAPSPCLREGRVRGNGLTVGSPAHSPALCARRTFRPLPGALKVAAPTSLGRVPVHVKQPADFSSGDMKDLLLRAVQTSVALPRQRGLDQPRPVGRAVRNDIIAEVVARMMQPGAVAVADENEGAG